MKTKKIIIKNFRNLKNFEFEVGKTTIIKGQNKLGKSNLLNALVWFITDTIYSENGAKDNDLSSIVPIDIRKGEKTSVEVEFENGTTYKKVYECTYDNVNKINGHKTLGYINGVLESKITDFNVKLLDALNVKHTFTSDIKELNFFVDPLYSFQKLDYKLLRKLLVNLGCSVSNDEIYKLGEFELLKAYDSKYNSDFVAIRKDLDRQLKELNKQIIGNNAVLDTFNLTEDESKIKAKIEGLNSTLEQTIIKISELKKGKNADLIKDLELEKEKLKQQLFNQAQEEITRLKLEEYKANQEVVSENKKLTEELDKVNKEYESKLKDYEYEYNKAKEQEMQNTALIDDLKAQALEYKALYENAKLEEKQASKELLDTTSSAFAGITCPRCGEHFISDTKALEDFNVNKEIKLKTLRARVEDLTLKMNDYKKRFDNLRIRCKSANERLRDAQLNILKYNEVIERVENEKAIPVQIDTSKLEQAKEKAMKIRTQIENVSLTPYNQDLIDLDEKIYRLKQEDNNEVEIKEQEEIKANIKLEIDACTSVLNDFEKRARYESLGEQLQRQYNDMNYLSALASRFIHKQIEMVNAKATKMFDLEFVMLEENLKNNDLQEVCYIKVDGVPFSALNTAMKYEVGIKFIEKVKDILESDFDKGRNDLPILADKFEGIDFDYKINQMTKEQLIVTRVTEDKEITITREEQ